MRRQTLLPVQVPARVTADDHHVLQEGLSEGERGLESRTQIPSTANPANPSYNPYEALDARAVAAVFPEVNVSSLQSVFNEFSRMTYDLRVAVDGVVIAADGQTASVNAARIRPVAKSVRVEPRMGNALFLLKKTGGDMPPMIDST